MYPRTDQPQGLSFSKSTLGEATWRTATPPNRKGGDGAWWSMAAYLFTMFWGFYRFHLIWPFFLSITLWAISLLERESLFFNPLTVSLHFPSNTVHIILIMSCGVVCVWPRTNSDTIVSMFIWFCYLEWMIYGGKLIWCDPLTLKICKVEGTVLVSVRIFVNKIDTYRLKRW